MKINLAYLAIDDGGKGDEGEEEGGDLEYQMKIQIEPSVLRHNVPRIYQPLSK